MEVGNLHVLVERIRVHVRVLEERIHVRGVEVHGVQNRIAKEDAVGAGSVEVDSAVGLIRRLIVVAQITKVVADAGKIGHAKNVGGVHRGSRGIPLRLRNDVAGERSRAHDVAGGVVDPRGGVINLTECVPGVVQLSGHV